MPPNIRLPTRKLLWMRCGGRCAFTLCGQTLEETNEREGHVLGIECHIVAQNDDPDRVARAVSSLSDDEKEQWAHLIDDRDGVRNLVVMCPNHSSTIDDPAGGYSVADVVEMKRQHEASVDEERGGQTMDASDAVLLQYAEIVQEWSDRVELDEWSSWMGGLFGDGHPYMRTDDFERLTEAANWLFSRHWPGTMPDLEEAFENFRWVASDLLAVLAGYPHPVLRDRGDVAPIRFYSDPDWLGSEIENARLHELYEWYVGLLEDLALELARAVNLVIQAVRGTIDPRFRADVGALIIYSGPYEDLGYRQHRPEYSVDDGWTPYNGLRPFLHERAGRDEVRGSGAQPDELRLPGDSLFGPNS